jgi:hypothetical protein
LRDVARRFYSVPGMYGLVSHDPLKKSQGESPALARATSSKAETWENTIGNLGVILVGLVRAQHTLSGM